MWSRGSLVPRQGYTSKGGGESLISNVMYVTSQVQGLACLGQNTHYTCSTHALARAHSDAIDGDYL